MSSVDVVGSVRLQPDFSGSAPVSIPPRAAEALELLEVARQPRMLWIGEVELIPSHAIAVRTARQRYPEMTDGQPLDERGWSDVEFRDDPVIVLAFRAHLLDAPDDVTVNRTDLAAEQQLGAKLIFFRHAGLLESSR